MKDILSPDCADVFDRIAHRRTLLAFDFDGTLAPIVAKRGDACLSPATQHLLGRLCRCFVCAVISGRSRADVLGRLGNVCMDYVFGNHGIETGLGLQPSAVMMKDAFSVLTNLLGHLPGVEIEDKTYSLALHYRKAPDPVAALAAIHSALAELPFPLHATDGKFVKNILPPGARHKGDALRMLIQAEGAECALFVGDDITDEDAFRLSDTGLVITVRVGADPSSSAQYFVENQQCVDTLLARLLALRDNGRGNDKDKHA